MAAREVGGDFYAYHDFGDGRVSLTVGDVSGKGLPAALLMSTSLTMFSTTIANTTTPAELLTYLDMGLAPYTRSTNQNCALCVIQFKNAHQTLTVANAGGVIPLVRHTNGAVEWLEAGGLPLGVGMGARFGYQQCDYSLQRGDVVVLVSDGIIEAHNPTGDLFGFDRMQAAVAGFILTTSAYAMLNQLRNVVNEFVDGAEQHDDMTILVVRLTR
ncbi:MAG: SpoIIE family protein phosphatase [Chloroflexaceae bacterium]|nr:SpoIIE family protein phosphatase [Chloroflexaceae bacterium]